MHCYIKYIPYEKYKEQTPKDFKTVNKTLLVNPNCFIGIIMEYIFTEVGIPPEEQEHFDLSSEKGKLKCVQTIPPNTYGVDILKDGRTYFLVDCSGPVVKPLLTQSSKEFIEFAGKKSQRVKSETGSTPASSNKGAKVSRNKSAGSK